MRFKQIELGDRAKIYPDLYKAEKAICDLSFTNLYGWATHYSTSWAVTEEGVLVIRFQSPLYSHPVFLLPYCPDMHVWETTILQIKETTTKSATPLVFMGVTPLCAENLEALFPNSFSFSWNENLADYVYLRERMVTLSGKKLQSKRNHINRFKKLYPDYSFRQLTSSDIPLYKDFADKWLQKEQSRDGVEAENKMIHRILDAHEELELSGGALLVGEQLVAITLGSPINYDTFDVHVEKADTDFEGAYTVINNEFAKVIPENYLYINREEDLGIPGLRFAKESYQPEKRLLKGMALLKNN
ncbi:DUF2156 domain-containing protein [Porphyromonas circumdentaria]|uniref:Phosphatidylglycerol lysyltransferase C-terminal domain-containing protein n=1 Tax=Porphyromonas circumdentaria TaxID=29524 RepID=A0A1T4LBW1_9PORP|nr:phosphatidylglycerol lysyltransferase domain-containing protein [Porphyromonas circumdentaria]MBB6275324.1 hypothetical protein [Porphyromonas circumdentaria]MDO4722812.1 phosphatidylglycerol lysyltransferase domain-containing protein [Porphyromonas circumdentaria]SJZ52123.1 hypothetical protein SAMN02745171_00352 [Porphyromonas circumdentaria]